ncbi:MAG: YbaK/prolyl-tRNA synthetase associated region [Marmoricola sp.]|nr:YbaK/prolyl-tRNA synthetase associated region [Marmoricola sp.]
MCSNNFKVHLPSDNPSRADPQRFATLPSMSETASEHPSITRFRRELEARGGTGRIVVLPDSVHTAQLAADALGCEVGAIANSLLFDADGEPLLLLTSGSHRVDTGKVAAELGIEQLRRAKPDFVRHHTGQVIGGVSPFDHPSAVRTYLDPWLRRHAEIWAAAGHPAAVFSSTYRELQQLTGADELEVE